MITPIETIDYRGVRIEILPDPDPCNPREDENLGTMICWHRRYKLGDLQPKEDPSAVLDDLCNQACPEYAEAVERLEEIERRLDGWCWSKDDMEYLTSQHPVLWSRAKAFVDRLRAQALLNGVMLPVYLMDHSGLSVNTVGFGCPWDSGQVGMIYCPLETARRYWAAPANAGWDWVVYPEEGLPN